MTIPNFITLIRPLTLPVLIMLVGYQRYVAALGTFLFAVVSDILDGILARALRQKSTLGSITDPIADKLLLSASFLTLGIKGLIPLWVMFLVLARDSVILTGLLFMLFTYKGLDISPSLIGKVTTWAQASLVVMTLLGEGVVKIPFLIGLALWVAVATTILSGCFYIYIGWKVYQGSGEGTRF